MVEDIQLIERFPEVDEYCRLRSVAGMSPKTPQAARKGLPSTLYGVSLRHGDEVVGMGRIIGDGGCFYSIVDLAVRPAVPGARPAPAHHERPGGMAARQCRAVRLRHPGGRRRDRLRGDVFVLSDDPADADTGGTKALVYVVRFVSKKNKTAGFGNVVRIVPVPIPDPPGGLTAEGSQDRITLRWQKPDRNADGSSPARIAGYNVYRTEDPKSFSPAPLNAPPVGTNEYADTSFQFDRKYYYSVSVVASKADPYAESAASSPLECEARDTFPPSDPRDLTSVVEGGVVILLWCRPRSRMSRATVPAKKTPTNAEEWVTPPKPAPPPDNETEGPTSPDPSPPTKKSTEDTESN